MMSGYSWLSSLKELTALDMPVVMMSAIIYFRIAVIKNIWL